MKRLYFFGFALLTVGLVSISDLGIGAMPAYDLYSDSFGGLAVGDPCFGLDDAGNDGLFMMDQDEEVPVGVVPY